MNSLSLSDPSQSHTDLLDQAMDNQFIKSETLDHHLVPGAHLWRLVRVTVKQDCIDGLFPGQSANFIICHALGGSDDPTGTLPLPESDRLTVLSCPLRFLDQARVRSEKWREAVRAFHHAMPSSISLPTPSSVDTAG
jgi:hypothetical protein